MPTKNDYVLALYESTDLPVELCIKIFKEFKYSFDKIFELQKAVYYYPKNIQDFYDICFWDISKITCLDSFSNLFISEKDLSMEKYDTEFDSDEEINAFVHRTILLKTYSGMEEWDVSNVTSMKSAFLKNEINFDISKWKIEKIVNMECAFQKATFINPNPDLTSWNTSNLEKMDYMFEDSNFNGDVSNFVIDNVKSLRYTFSKTPFRGDISNWNTINVTKMDGLFHTSEFNGDISKWKVENVISMNYMFHGSKFNGDISKWKIDSVKYMGFMFHSSSFNGNLEEWDISKVQNLQNMFEKCPFTGKLANWNIKKLDSENQSYILEYWRELYHK